MKTQNYLVSLCLLALAGLSGCKDEVSATPAASVQAVKKVQYTAPVVKVCDSCGTISSIETMRKKGEGSGIGIAAGAVLGAVIGHQIGGGRGQDVATATGAIGGGFAGNEIEKQARASTYYHITVNMESGGSRTVDVSELNGLSSGQKVRVVGNNIQMAGS